jgi:Tfp pilus assembly protein PilF
MKTATASLLIASVCFLLMPTSFVDAKVPEVVLKQKGGVVTIYVTDNDGGLVSCGTGFFVDAEGTIATNHHVVASVISVKNNLLMVRLENGAYFALDRVLTWDEQKDLALIKVRGTDTPALKLSTSQRSKQGDDVYVIGSPLGLELSVSEGVVSAVRKGPDLLQITAAVSPGSSGSPVFNNRGEVIGAAVSVLEGGQNINFAIPATQIKQFIAGYKKEGAKAPASSPSPGKATAVGEHKNEMKEEMKRLMLKKPLTAVERLPSSPMAWFNLALTYRELDMTTEAVQAYKKAIDLKHDFAIAHFFLATAYGSLGMQAENIASLQRAASIDPTLADAHFFLGVVYTQMGLNSLALERMQAAVKTQPNNLQAKFALALLYENAGRTQDALRQYNEIVKIDPDSSYAHWVYALTYLNRGDREGFRREYKILEAKDSGLAERMKVLIEKIKKEQ